MTMNRALAALAVTAILGTGCSRASAGTDEPLESLRLGYFANVTHAPALVGVADGFFEEELGAVPLETVTFNAGSEAVEALFSGAIDMAFMGPNPAINAYSQSDGEAVRIVAGSTSGGAALVVADGIDDIGDLMGTTIATPALGNTQDVALRAWLESSGLETTLEGGGDVAIVPQANAQTLETFRSGQIQGAWVPEPWATRLVEGGGHVLVDERDLWPGGQFVTTHLVVATSFLEAHPDAVTAMLRGLIRSIDDLADDPARAQRLVNDQIEAITGSSMSAEVMTRSWANLTFTVDPIADSLATSAANAVRIGLLEPVDLDGIYSLDLLNDLLRAQGREEVGP
jgi:sulfonate transport system substrate-binding protein